MNTRTLALLGAMAVCATTATAHGQSWPATTLDVTKGRGTERTDGVYVNNHTGLAFDGMLAVRVRKLARGALVAGVNASWQSADESYGDEMDTCRPAIDCMRFPDFEMVGATLGWQDRSAIVRASAGAACRRIGTRGRWLGRREWTSRSRRDRCTFHRSRRSARRWSRIIQTGTGLLCSRSGSGFGYSRSLSFRAQRGSPSSRHSVVIPSAARNRNRPERGASLPG